MSNNNLILLRHGPYNRGTGNLFAGAADKIGDQVANLLNQYGLSGDSFGILTSKYPRTIQTGEGILRRIPGASLLETTGSDLVIEHYPSDENFGLDITKLSSQSQLLLENLRQRMEETSHGIILVGHEPSIFGLSEALNLGLTKQQISRYEGLPLMTTLN